jgi:hypothetical protein
MKDWKDYDAWVAQAEEANKALLAQQEENQVKMELVLQTVDELKESGKSDAEVLEQIGNLIDEE